MSIATRIQAIEEHISDAYDSLSKFGVAAPSNKNIENIASLVNEIYDNTPKTDYASGTNLTLENTRVGKIDFKDTDTIEKIGLGAISQNSNPTPDSPQDINVVKGNQNILVQNKNLIEEVFKGYNINGRGQFEQVESSSAFDVNIAKVQAGETYILNTTTNVIAYFNTKPTTSSTSYNNAREVITATNTLTPTRSGYIAIRTATSNTTQLEKGTTTTSYVSHQENNYEINLSSKNLFPSFTHNRTINGVTISSNNGELTIKGTATASINEPVWGSWGSSVSLFTLPAGTYTLSGAGVRNQSPRLNVVSNGTTTIFKTGATQTFSNNMNITGIFIYIDSGTSVDTTFKYQIEKGSDATSYASYFIPIELYKINTYQDYIYKNGKNWYLHKENKKVIIDENTSIQNDTFFIGQGRFNIIQYSDGISGSSGNAGAISTHFKGAYETANGNVYLSTSHNINLINTDYINDLDGFKTWLSTNKPEVYYVLATPIETQITDSTLISQLDAWYNAQSMDDTTHITVDGDLPIQLKLKALKK